MKATFFVAFSLLVGCTRPPGHTASADRPSVPRKLEISAVFHFPPGASNGYIIQEADDHVEAYAYDLREPSKRWPLTRDRALGRFIDRVDSLIVNRSASDTSLALAPNQRELCGDGVDYGARLTFASTTRRIGANSCGDQSPGFYGRFVILSGIVDSLARLARPR